MVHGKYSSYTYGKCRCEKCKAAGRAYRQNYQPEYYRKNREKRKAKAREHYAKNHETIRSQQKSYYEDHRRSFQIKTERYRARVHKAFVEDIDRQFVFERDNGICQLCGKPVDEDFHLDHRIPLSKGGKHEYMNIQLAHPICNHKKAAQV